MGNVSEELVPDIGIWRCLLFVTLIVVGFLTVLPLTFVETTAQYLANLEAGLDLKLDSQTPEHIAAAFLIGVLAALSIREVKLASVGRYCLPGLAIGWLGLELIQAAAPGRHANITDLSVNVVVSSVGAVSAAFAWQREVVRRVLRHVAKIGPGLLFAGLAVGFTWFTIRTHIRTTFENWDDTFPLALGNELTGNRPWRGDVSGLAIYPACLTTEQVSQLAQAWPNGRKGLILRRQIGAVALYTFGDSSGAALSDRADVEKPLNLYVVGPGDPLRVADRGLRFLKSGLARTLGPARVVALAAKQSNEISVEVICEPADLEQEGPARIVTMSINPLERNFTLAQEGADLVFRLRTPGTGPNGTGKLAPRWPDVFTGSRLQHLTVTYANGKLRLFVDGTEHKQNIFLYSARVQLGIDNPASDLIAEQLVSFLLGVLGVASWRWRRPPLAITIGLLIGVLPLVITYLACAISLNRPLQWELIFLAPTGFAVGIALGLPLARAGYRQA